jgi:hypothetical protein
MNRLEFIKKSSITFLGLSSGLLDPTKLLAGNRLILKMPNERETFITIPNDDEEIWISWLGRLVASSLISAFAAKIVERYTDNCICDGTTCRKSPADYSNAVGIYGYDSHNTRLVTQQVTDNRVTFQNVSVPFLNTSNVLMGNVEGPFLAGMCWAANDLQQKYGIKGAKKAFLPIGMTQNGGYRFDTDPCYPTVYKTNHGKTQISYNPSGNTGNVNVKVLNEYDNLGWEKTYNFNYV